VKLICNTVELLRPIGIAGAEKAGVNLFRRFALMRRWCVDGGIVIARTSDWATNGVAHALYGAIKGALPATA
jgi:acyl-CoA thioesterase-1